MWSDIIFAVIQMEEHTVCPAMWFTEHQQRCLLPHMAAQRQQRSWHAIRLGDWSHLWSPPSRHGFWGLVIPHYLNGRRSQNASWLLTSFKILPHSLPVLQVNREDNSSTGVWHRRLRQFVGVTAAVRGGLLLADGALKKIWPVGLGGGRDH